ncbi:hypothetical protein ACFOGJ_22225 [Marinibaculum pumilum]|uniref:O-GlcNAc transferase C-terminal domain-containing protein n=1 Tax=Marinibaculum pumilum TaxID=1766165 RepID=A0ABV7L609_9PROT
MAENPPGDAVGDPDLPPAMQAAWQRAVAAGNAGRYGEALATVQDLLARHPDHNSLLHTAVRIAHNAHDSERAFRLAWDLARRSRGVHARHQAYSLMTFWAPFVSYLNREGVAAVGRQWAQHLAAVMRGAPLPPQGPRPADRRLRVGYMSPAFGFPSDYQPLGHHDPDRLESFAYSSGARPLGRGTVVPKFGTFRDLHGMSDSAAAHLIRQDDLDILVDLGGTGDAQRNGILAYRPARIQVGWSNKLIPQYGPLLDWVIGDAELFAPGDFIEPGAARLLALPQSVCAVVEMTQPPPPVPPPILTNARLTIGSPASAYKISEATLALWSRILHRLPQAVFAYNTPFLSDLVESKIRDGFAAHGIGPERYSLTVRRDTDFPTAMNGVDLALDAIPFSSNFSCLQTLRQGVPVITLAGDRLPGRLGSSILRTAGLTELVAATPEAYVEAAVALAADPARLRAYRSRLPAAIREARLVDMRLTAHCLERAYEQIWQMRAEGGAE